MFERVAPEQFDTLPEIPEPCENPLMVGHEEVRAQLSAAIEAGKLHHAILLAGPQGIGKATLAFNLAHRLLGREGTQAGQDLVADPASQAFRLVAQGAHPSLLHLTRPYVEKDKKFRTVITVDEIRRVSRFLSMTAFDGGYRIVIVDPADDMNVAAANALLKSLEEPPPRTVFILISHSLGRLLPTIRSRCQVMRLQPLADEVLPGLLERFGADLPSEPGQLTALLERAKGSPRAAFLLTQYGGLEIAAAIDTIIGAARFDVDQAYRLGDAVTGREREVQFSIFNASLQEHVERRALAAGGEGRREEARVLSETWEAIAARIRETETYNLDRRQHAVGILEMVHRTLKAA